MNLVDFVIHSLQPKFAPLMIASAGEVISRIVVVFCGVDDYKFEYRSVIY